jgi:hypothetical protein
VISIPARPRRVEEPELYLRPQTQRWCSRLLRRLAAGNQVVYATHSPAFLKVARMDELVFVERRRGSGTKALRPPPLTPDEDFRVLSEFDAERAELFLARAALLVEGSTEKLALPFVFAALPAVRVRGAGRGPRPRGHLDRRVRRQGEPRAVRACVPGGGRAVRRAIRPRRATRPPGVGHQPRAAR